MKKPNILTRSERIRIVSAAAVPESDLCDGLALAMRLARSSGSLDEARSAIDSALKLARRIRREIADDEGDVEEAVVENGKDAAVAVS